VIHKRTREAVLILKAETGLSFCGQYKTKKDWQFKYLLE